MNEIDQQCGDTALDHMLAIEATRDELVHAALELCRVALGYQMGSGGKLRLAQNRLSAVARRHVDAIDAAGHSGQRQGWSL